MSTYKSPGVYIEEIWRFPPSVAEVDTAIPAFIGYTQKADKDQPGDLLNRPTRIKSFIEYRHYFGEADSEKNIEVTITAAMAVSAKVNSPSKFQLYYSLQLFFANGGGPCYIVSVGSYAGGKVNTSDMEAGLEKLKLVDEVTLIVFPDSMNLPDHTSYYGLQEKAIQQCAELQDRFVIMDVFRSNADWKADIANLRSALQGDTGSLKFAAAYFPALAVALDYNYKDPLTGQDNDALVKIVSNDPAKLGNNLGELKALNNALYWQAKQAINDCPMILPAAPAIAGIYASVDRSRGVWKAPANVNINAALNPVVTINDREQESLNVDPARGLSINAIRTFTGRGPALVWGARTLAGNDNEWRYVNVRRYFNMIGESIKKSTEWAVFEPNTAATWVSVKAMVENYLTLQWRQGALQGAKPEHAFYVKVGLGETMTQQDLLEGRMIVEIGMAVVRPAEFVILRFSHKLLEE